MSRKGGGGWNFLPELSWQGVELGVPGTQLVAGKMLPCKLGWGWRSGWHSPATSPSTLPLFCASDTPSKPHPGNSLEGNF